MFNANQNSYSITLLGAGGGPANYMQMVNLANSVLYAYVCLVPDVQNPKVSMLAYSSSDAGYGSWWAGSVAPS